MTSNAFLKIALQAAKAGEEVIRHYYDANIKVTMKQDYTPVTVADIETEQKIKEVMLEYLTQRNEKVLETINAARMLRESFEESSIKADLMENLKLLLGVVYSI